MSNQTRTILRITIIVSLIFLQIIFYGATRISSGNGNWHSGGTWVGGVAPNCGDSVVILTAHTVTIANQQDYEACGSELKMSVFGTLKFDNGNKLKLPCNSYIYINAGGRIVPGSGGGNSNYIEICNVIVWRASDGMYNTMGCMGCSFLLPIELLKFDVENLENKIAINWSTASEQNTDYFLVERSVDGIEWKIVTKEKAAENSSHTLYYEVSDETPVFGMSYYRLRMVEKNLAESYSDIKSVERIKKESRMVVFPNPSHGEITIECDSYTISYEVFDLKGKKISPNIHKNLQNKISLDFSNCDKGVYFINVHTPEDNQYVQNKVIIE